MTLHFVIGARTDVGRGRPANEDSFLIDDEQRLYAVADGMGGHRAGEVASATAIESLRSAFGAGRPLTEAVSEANAAVFAKASSNLDMRGMGTTLTAVNLTSDPAGGQKAVLGHVGDSRAYLMRDGGVTQVTDDHSLVEQLVREGKLRPEEAAHHPQRAIITRALGVDPDVEVDTYQVDLRPGDRLLLASDGLTNMVADDTIGDVLRRQPDPQLAANTLVDLANQAGGDDNITVVLIDAVGEAAAGAAATAAAGARGGVDEPTAEWVPEDLLDPPEEPPRARATAAPPPPPAHPRRISRILAWALPVLLLAGVGIGAVGWYARKTYYVGLSQERVTLFRGVPGGLLGWDPTVEDRSALTASELTPAQKADLEGGHRFASRTEAAAYIDRLEESRVAAPEPTGPAPEPASGPEPAPGTTPETTPDGSTTTSFLTPEPSIGPGDRR